MKKYFLFLFLLFLYSCKNNIAVDLPPFEEKLVAISYLEEGDSSYIIYLNKTFNPQQHDYWKYADTSFATATVVISLDGVPFTLRRMSISEHHKYSSAVFNSYGRFFALDKKIEHVTTLTLTAKYLDKNIASACTLLPTPHIENAKLTGTLSNAGYYTQVKALLESDFPSGTTYYLVRIVQLGYTAKGYFISSNAQRTKEFHFNNTLFSSDFKQRNCLIIFSRVEKTYYDFALTSQAQRGELDTFLPTETTEVPSNIQGGYGIFTIMNSDTVRVTIQ